MKRKNELYKEICDINHIMRAFEEVCKNTKNKKKVAKFREYKCIHISKIYNVLNKRKYEVGPYNVFTIYEPKKRRIVSQNMIDKTINHLVARYILMPAIIPCLIDQNVASRKNMGVAYGIKYLNKYRDICECKYKEYYILKCDISAFFASINQEILQRKLERKIKDKEALEIVYKIIKSEENGLGIGNMTSQILAIFYLNDLDHYIKEKLKIKYYIRYQDDFLLIHHSKEYLKECLNRIEEFLRKEKLILNKKTRIYKNTNNFIFLGRSIKGKYANYRNIKRKIKKKQYLYLTQKISLMSYASTIICYKNLVKKIVV